MIYAINKRTKEHRVVPRFGVYSNHDWRYVVADAEGWIAFDGEEIPTNPDQFIQWKGYSGFVSIEIQAGAVNWGKGGNDKIIAYRPILDAKHSEPEAPEWDGEGLPPVGCECEVDWSCGGDWRAVKIIHYSGGKIWVRDTRGDHIIWEDATFRPIRSEEDRAVEDMARTMYECDAAGNLSAYKAARALCRAGYRKTGDE